MKRLLFFLLCFVTAEHVFSGTLGQGMSAGTNITRRLFPLNANSHDTSGWAQNLTDTTVNYAATNGLFGNGAYYKGSAAKSTSTSLTGLGAVNEDLTMSIWVCPVNTNTADSVAIGVSWTTGVAGYAIHFGRETSSPGAYFVAERFRNNVADDWIGDLVFDGSWKAPIIVQKNWYNAILTWKSSTATGTLYLNGCRIQQSVLNTGTGSGSTSYKTSIGVGVNGSQYSVQNAQEARIEKEVWSDSKVAHYYTFGKGRFASL